MQFYIEGYVANHDIKESNMSVFPHIKLVTDDFDDFGYETLFRMYYKKEKYSSYLYIGKVKILHITAKTTRSILEPEFKQLNPEFCSLGQSIDYYSTIRSFNKKNKEVGSEILTALNDIAVYHSIEEKFTNNHGLFSSLLRDSEAYHAYMKGHNTFYNISTNINEKVQFTFTYNKEYSREVSFVFNDDKKLPSRINVIVGKNGPGKTEVLSTLASVLSGYSRNDNCEVSVRPEFSRYIAISYSAFDNFDKPFNNEFSKKDALEEKKRIYNEIRILKNKCRKKIKDKNDDFSNLHSFFSDWEKITKEFEQDNEYDEFFDSINDDNLDEEEESDKKIGSYVYCGIKKKNRIISEDEMFSILSTNLKKIKNKQRLNKWHNVVTEIFDDESSVNALFRNSNINNLILKKNFVKLSSGQKIILHIFTEVIESITDDSLLLIDEPEIHLHPNAISNFMRVLNRLLLEFNSFSIISTHSPIILQEVPSRYIRIFDNNEMYDRTLYEECFGENISRIISNVFDVRPDESNYKEFFLDKKKNNYSKSQIEQIFENNLSFNAKLYLNFLYGNEMKN